MSKPKLYETRLDLNPEIRLAVVKVLNKTLAITLDLKTQTKQAHWNIKGLNFFQLHELFDETAGVTLQY